MVEVLIAGILLASALAAVSRISVAALSGSASLSDRTRIEAAINDNIQAMQKEDSYYTDAWIIDDGGQDALQSACTNPPEALSNHLQTVAPEPRLATITRTFDFDSIPGILRIIYSFEGPEQQVKSEQRIIEMTPNFAAKCYKTR
jgi:type II secretory pathway pseudopilin PulG